MPSLDDALDASAADPLDAAIDSAAQDKTRLRQSLTGAVRQNPDEYARATQLARTTGLPAPVVARNLKTVEQRSAVDALDAAVATAPVLSRLMENPDFASLGHDDAATLSSIEALVNARVGGGRIGGPAFRREHDRLTASRGPEAGFSSIAAGLGQALPQGGELARQGIRAQVADLFGFGEMSADAIRRSQQAQSDVALTTPEFESSTARGVYSGLTSLVRQAPGVVAAILTRNPSLALGTIGAQTEAEAYGKYRGRGAMPGQAFVGGTGEGAVEVATEMLPMSFLVKNLGRTGAGEFLTGLLAREVPSEQIATVLQDALDTAIANPDKTWAQYAAERPDAAYQTLVATVTQGGAMGAINTLAQRLGGASQAEREATLRAQLMGLAAASKLRTRDPQSFQEFVEAAAPGQDVYLDVRTLQQAGVDVQALAQSSPAVAAQLAEAIDTGGDLVIPVAEYAARIAGTDLDPVLTPHLRTAEDALSLDEANRFYQGQAEEFRAVAAKVMEDKATDTAWQTSAKAVETKLFDELKNAGRFTDDVNSAYATLMRDFYVATAARLGLTPEEMFARYPLKVATERAAADARMEQADYNENYGFLPDAGSDAAPLDADRLADLRRQAAGLEKPEAGVTLHVTETGEAIATGPKGARVPESFTRFAEANGLRFQARRKLPSPSVTNPTNADRIGHQYSEPMPLDYRVAGALYFNEMGQAWLDRTGKTLFQKDLAKANDSGYTADKTLNQEGKDDSLDFTGSRPGTDRPGLQAGQDVHRTVAGGTPREGWADATRVRRRDGKPAVVYRGAGRPLGAADFGRDALGHATGNPSSGLGVWFTPHRDEAGRYGEVASFHLDLRRPKVIKIEDLPGFDTLDEAQNFSRSLQAQGYDGIAVDARHVGGPVHFVAFTPETVIVPPAPKPLDISQFFQGEKAPTETPEFKRWSNGNRVVALDDSHAEYFKAGEAVVVEALHGTTGDFTAFDAARANPESDMGAGFYFTNTEEDVSSNYAGEGPDLTQKIQMRAEQIAGETDREYSDPEVVAEAKAQLAVEHGGMAMPVWVRFDNPVVLGGSEETQFTYEYPYDEEADEYGEETGTLVDFIMALRDAAEQYHDGSVEDAVAALVEKASDNGGISASDLVQTLSDSEEFGYYTDGNGVLVRKEIMRQAFEAIGHDGIIDQTVNQKFGSEKRIGKPMEGMYENTVHFIAFEPTQIKSRIGNRGTFDPNDPDILKQNNRGEIAFGQDITQVPSVISLYKNADLSTLLHEMGHFQLEVLAHIASQPDAPTEIVADMEKVLKWFGIQGGEQVGRGETAGSLGQPLTEQQFYDRYYAHVDVRGREQGTADANREAILKEGFKSGRVNALPLTPGELGNVMSARYAPKAGDVVYLVPPEARVRTPNGTKVKDGWKPKSYEVVTITDPDKSLYEYFTEGQREGGTFAQGDDVQTPDPAELPRRLTALETWHAMSLDEKRPYHEQFARGFESYLFEGKAPSAELTGLFARFRAWLINVYKSIKALNVEINDDIRGVFDRMLATDEAIAQAEAARNMAPLFTSADQIGSRELFAEYQRLTSEATQDAVNALQRRGLRDMRWLTNARGRILKRLQAEAKEKRAEAMIDARREVMGQPVYRAWQFLTGRLKTDDKVENPKPPKSSPGGIDETIDPMFVAIAKLGGLRRDEVVSTWGIDPADRPASGLFGLPVWRREGGLSLDGMAEALAEFGYLPTDEHGKADLRDFEEKFKAELGGDAQYAWAFDYDRLRPLRPGEQIANPAALGAGRFAAESLDEMGLPAEVVGALKARRMVAANGLHPDIVAEMFGFTSGDQLARELAAAHPPAEAIEGLTDQRVLERYGDLANPDTLARAADEAIHNEARARFVATELKALTQATGPARAIAKAAKSFAEAALARKRVRDIKPRQYAAAEVRAAKAAEKAFAAGDTATAANEKRNQLLQNYGTRLAYEALTEIDRAVKYLRKFDSEGARKGLDPEYVDQIDALLDRFDLRTSTTAKDAAKRASLLAWVEAQREQGFEPDIPPDLLSEALRKPYRDLTLEELRGLVDTVKQIEHLGRLKQKLLTAKDKREFAAVVTALATSIEEHAKGTRDLRTRNTTGAMLAEAGNRFLAMHRKMASMAREMDGFADGGPMWEYFIRTMNEAGDRETGMRAEATAKLYALVKPIIKAGKMGGKGQYFPTLGMSLNREERLAIALNLGNAGNMQRLLDGEGWTLARLQPVLDTLTAEDADFIQAVWDFFEAYRPEIAAKERRIYGKEPEWVEPVPITLGGKALRGGYYPIRYDAKRSGRAEQHAEAEAARQQMRGAYTTATTRRSFTKARAEEVKGRPLVYSFTGLYQGANEVIHDLAWHEWLIDANRLLRALDGPIRSHHGAESVAVFKKAIEDIATGDEPAANVFERGLNHMRTGATIAGLGWNLTTAMLQPFGLTQSMVRVGPGWVAKGIGRWFKAPLATVEEITGKSALMRDRARTMQREINEIQNQVRGGKLDPVRSTFFFLIQKMQMVADVPTWIGAYEKAVAEGNAEERAVALADQAVLDAQGGGQTKDLAQIQRGHPALKLFTNFYSFFNVAYNLGVEKTKQKITQPKLYPSLALDYLLLYSVPAVLATLLRHALSGGDDDELAEKLAADQLSYLLGLMVGVREVTAAAQKVAGVEQFKGAYGGPAGMRLFQEIDKLGQQISQGEADMALLKAINNVAGIVFHYPSGQINRTVDGAAALIEGKTENPAVLVVGPPKP